MNTRPEVARRWGLLEVLVAFGLSRAWAYRAAVRLDLTPLGTYWQYIDPVLLRGHLWQSLFYLHGQPPLFNLFLGVVVSLFPGHEGTAFHAAYLGFGIILAVTLYLLMLRLGASAAWAALLTTGLVVSPACLAFENFLFYSYPVAAVLLVSALFLHRFLEKGRRLDGGIFFVLLAVLVLSRTIFQLVWLVAVAMGLLWVSHRHKCGLGRRILLTAALPTLLAFSLYAKNAVVFGGFSSSTWLGMNLATMTVQVIPPEERLALQAQGKISDVSLVVPFEPLDRYPERFRAAPTGIPVLDEIKKPSGDPNFNNLAYIGIARAYEKDAFTCLREHPDEYLDMVLVACWNYLRPSSQSLGLNERNQVILRPLETVYRAAFLAFPVSPNSSAVDPTSPDDLGAYLWSRILHRGLLLELGLPVVLLYGGWRILKLWPRPGGDFAVNATLAYLGFTCLYFTLISVTLNGREANRVRFEITPCLLVLFMALAVEVFSAARRAWRRKQKNTAAGK
jgi:hypothetical protein